MTADELTAQFVTFQGELRSFLLRMTASVQDAEDLVQATFERFAADLKRSGNRSTLKKIASRRSLMEKRTKDNPWKLKTPPGTSEYEMYVDTRDGKEILVCTVGTTVLHYDYRCLTDLHAMLKQHGDWMELGSKDEKQEAVEGTVEHWARSPKNPIGGWYGLKRGFRGRFAMYIPPLMEELGLANVEHNPRNNRMRAK